jgi:pimeloyl-ACP methyl ester carboxylesterase
MHYLDWKVKKQKETPNGRPNSLLCVHGLTRLGRDFDWLATSLLRARAYERVVCPDVVGRGRSDHLFPNAPFYQQYGYPLYVSNITALIGSMISEADEKIDYVGTSMGGIIGLMIAATPGNPIRRLVLNDIGAIIEREALVRIASYVSKERPPFPSMSAVVDCFVEIYSSFGLTRAHWEHLAPFCVKPASNAPQGHYQLSYDLKVGHMLSDLSTLKTIELWSLWDNIKCPVLLIRGEHSDILSSSCVMEMKRRNPNLVRVYTAPGVGHAPGLADDAQIRAITEFLTADEDDLRRST